MRTVVNVLAVVGAFALAALLAVGIWFAGASRPAAPVPGGDTTPGTSSAERLTRVEADVVVPFALVEQDLGEGARVSAGESGLLRVVRPVTLLGRTLDVTVDARVTAAGDSIVAEPVRVVEPRLLAPALERVPGIRRSVAGLPAGMRIESVQVVEDGLAVHATGRDVPLPG